MTSVVQLRNTNISNEKLSLPEQNGGLRNFRQFNKRVEATLRKLKCSATSRNISFSRDAQTNYFQTGRIITQRVLPYQLHSL